MSNTHHSHVYASLYEHPPITCQASGVTFQRNSYSRLCFSHRFNSNEFQNYYTVFRKTAWKPHVEYGLSVQKKKRIDYGIQTASEILQSFQTLLSCSPFDVVCCQGLWLFSCKKSSCRHKCLNKDKSCHILPFPYPSSHCFLSQVY